MSMSRALPLVVLAGAVVVGALGCGQPPLVAPFTSRVIQREVCRVVGDRPEVCTREEAIVDVRVRLVERDDGAIWLYGIPRGGVSDRAILGTRDSRGGFLFVDESVQENDASGCVVGERLEISVAIQDDIEPGRVGVDPCVPLVGRETEQTTLSAGCDTVNVPPLPSTLTVRRRWESPPECTPPE